MDSDGHPIPISHVHIHAWPGGEVLASAAVDPDGNWSLAIDTTGVFLAWFSGVGHRGERAGLFLTGDEERIEIDVRLGRHDLRDTFDAAALIGDFNDFAVDRGSLPLHQRPDGLRAIDVHGERVEGRRAFDGRRAWIVGDDAGHRIPGRAQVLGQGARRRDLRRARWLRHQ